MKTAHDAFLELLRKGHTGLPFPTVSLPIRKFGRFYASHPDWSASATVVATSQPRLPRDASPSLAAQHRQIVEAGRLTAVDLATSIWPQRDDETEAAPVAVTARGDNIVLHFKTDAHAVEWRLTNSDLFEEGAG